MTAFGEFEIVSDDDAGEGVLLMQRFEKRYDTVRGAVIEVAGGLIGEEDFGGSDEGSGEGNTLLFASGEFAGAVMAAGAEADFGEFCGCLLGSLRGRDAADEERHHDVFEGGEFGEQVVALPDEADFAIAEVAEGGVGELGDVLGSEEDAAGCGTVKAAEEVEESGFAGAGFADDRDSLALGDFELEVLEDDDFRLAGRVALGQIFGSDCADLRRPRHSSSRLARRVMGCLYPCGGEKPYLFECEVRLPAIAIWASKVASRFEQSRAKQLQLTG